MQCRTAIMYHPIIYTYTLLGNTLLLYGTAYTAYATDCMDFSIAVRLDGVCNKKKLGPHGDAASPCQCTWKQSRAYNATS